MTGPRRVLMTADSVGGVWTYSLGLARQLTSVGTHVCLAVMGRRLSEEQRAEAAEIPGISIRESSYKLEWMQDPWEDVDAAGDWLLGIERDLSPDIVHLNGYVHGSLRWQSPAVVVAHSCVYSWWNAVRGGEPGPEWNTYRARVRAGLRAAHGRIAISKFAGSELSRWYGDTGQVETLYNGVDSSTYGPTAKEDIVLSCGRLWDEAKNMAAVDRAARTSPWPVYVAGQAANPEGGTAQLASVSLLGQLGSTELKQWYGRAAIYALPARYEPFGLSALEAALSGCALILGDIPSLRELWEGAAIFVSPDDPDALSEAISLLASQPALRQRLAELARVRGRTYSAERMLTSYLRSYSEVIASHQRRSADALCAS